ncbi:putative quinol monooxygenase [Undibacterium sp.]|uniref:putative quinol monooxygenase n=1 Tax=Undibacterium sp. TaxID=1914977 RepID=UPI00374D73C9
MSDSISFIVHLPAKPEVRERMRKMTFDVLDAMSAEPDFINTWVHEDLNDPDTLVIYENWACSRDYFLQHHLSKPYRQAFEAALPDMLSHERRIEFLKGIRSYPGRALSA